MPNWCFVEMYCDTPEEMDKVMPFLCGVNTNGEECELTFNNVVPTPQYVYQGDEGEEDRQRYGVKNCWFAWNNEHWGTKWDACEVSVEEGHIYFSTAWTAPLPWMEALAKALNNLDPEIAVHFKCDFEGDGWQDWTIQGGELKLDDEGDEDRWSYDEDEE